MPALTKYGRDSIALDAVVEWVEEIEAHIALREKAEGGAQYCRGGAS